MALLAGCQQSTPQDEAVARQNDTTLVNPPGRYQMVAIPDGSGVYLLDTRYGRLRVCPRDGPNMVCGSATENDGRLAE